MPSPSSRRRERRRRRDRRIIAVLLVAGVILSGAGLTWSLVAARAQPQPLDATEITWPAAGVGAVAIGDRVAVSPGGDAPLPIASLTKLVTALVVLDRQPLRADASGPSYTMTAADAEHVAVERARGGQWMPVTVGQVLTQRQLLEYVLVGSSNNFASSLADHVFGGEDAFLAAARDWLREHDLDEVEIADASGMSADSRATARDVLTLGRIAASDPLISGIAALAQITGRDGAVVANTDDLLGTLGIDGLKTGHTTPAGYTVVFTASVAGERVVGVVLGSPTLAQRTTDVTRLLGSLRALAAG